MSCSDTSKTDEASCTAAGATWTTMGGRRHRITLKGLKRALKKQGKKVTGKKSTLVKRLKMRGGEEVTAPAAVAPATVAEEGGRRRTRRREEGGRRRRRSTLKLW